MSEKMPNIFPAQEKKEDNGKGFDYIMQVLEDSVDDGERTLELNNGEEIKIANIDFVDKENNIVRVSIQKDLDHSGMYTAMTGKRPDVYEREVSIDSIKKIWILAAM